MAKWFLEMKKADFNAIASQFHIDPLIARIIRNRDIILEDEIRTYLYGKLEDLHSPKLLKDADKITAILKEKIGKQKRIRIIGDYDIDGVCASYILWKGLSECGARVDTVLPDRIKDGYGINAAMLLSAAEEGIDTIITCDNGIAAIDEIAYGKKLGLTILVTDHHEMPYLQNENGEKIYSQSLADAVVNPKQPECTYPFPFLCGAAVAYKVVELLLSQCDCNSNILSQLLEFAAFATIGDVMPLQGENRIIVKYGMDAIRHTKNKGMRALLTVNEIADKKLSSYHIGFILGPCVNATGRLDSAKRALELFCANDDAMAARLAGDLKALNDSRKVMTNTYVEQAIQMVEQDVNSEDSIIVLYLPECHESIAGIIAGRIREKYYKPVFVLTKSEEGVKGSGRSIEAWHMFEEMSKCKELLTKYGGHSQAAGLSMPEENIDAFRWQLNENALLTQEDLTEKIHIDAAMPFSYISKELVKQLTLLEPFGIENRKPLFAQKNVHLTNGKILGKQKNAAKFTARDESGTSMEAIYFGDVEAMRKHIANTAGSTEAEKLFLGMPCEVTLNVIYTPSINEFGGRETLQITIQEYC